MSNKTSQLRAGSLLSYIQMAVSIIVGILYTPIMIRLLGKSEYGLYSTVSSTIAMLSILNLGFKSGYVRYFAKYKKEGDEESIAKLNGLYLIIFSVIGAIALVCGLFLTFNLKLVFSTGLTDKEYITAKVLMLLLTINLATSFPFGVFSNIISTNERFIFLKVVGIIRTVVNPIIVLPLLLLGYGSIAIVVVTITLNLLSDFIYILYVVKVLKNKFVFHGFEKGLFKGIFGFTIFIAINLIVDQINWNIDKVLLGRLRGTASVAVYAVASTLHSYYLMFSTSISSVFTPRIYSLITQTENDKILQRQKLTELFIKVGRIQFLILGLIASGLVFFGKPFISFWAGVGYEEAYYVALLLILPVTIPLIQNLGIEIQRAQNKHKFRSILYLCMAIANLALSIILIKSYGAIGAAIGTAISLLIVNGLIINIYYHKKCNINVVKFFASILRLCVGLIIPVIVGVVIIRFVPLYNIWLMLLFILIYSVIYIVSMWLFAMNSFEKDLIRKPLKKLFGK